MSTETAPAAPTARLVFLDWLRILAFGLLVLYHVGMYYVTWDWHVKSAFAGPAIEPWMRLVSPWRLDLLFLISGAATSFMLARSGAAGSLPATRAKRLLIPLAFGMLVIVPPQSYLEVVQKYGYGGSYLDFMRLYLSGYGGFCAGDGQCLILPTWNHLWFLPYLFLYTLVLWGLLRRRPDLLDAAALRAPALLRGARLFVLPVLLLVLTRIALRDLFPVTHALVDDWFSHAQYLAMFALGAVLTRAPAIWERFMQARRIALVVGLAAWALLVFVPLSAWGPALVARPLVYSVLQWCGIVAAVGFARRHLNRDHALRRYLTDAVFPVYILHQTVTIVLARVPSRIEIDPVLEGGLLVIATFVLSFAGYECVRRVRWLRPLFGLKAGGSDRAAAKPGTLAAADRRTA
jgi:peptidoglycan/LPS O-acetylase OafA/YrhL